MMRTLASHTLFDADEDRRVAPKLSWLDHLLAGAARR
jgi:hypothetical protein